MSKTEMITLINELSEIEALIAEAKEQAESLRDSIKGEMLKRNAEELVVDGYIIRWTPVLSNRFDSASFKKALPDVYKAYTKQVSSRRFTINK